MTAIAEVTAPPASHPQSRSRRPRWLAPVGVGAAGLLATAYVAWQDPNGDGAYPLCPTHSLLGIDCPGCGGLRATHALTQGDVVAAFDHNLVVTMVLPVFALLWAMWLLRSLGVRTPHVPVPTARTWWVLGTLLLAFTVVRNLSGPGLFEYLAATA